MAKNILLLLFASICISAAAQTPKFKLVTTQLSKGSLPGEEYMQLLVDGKNTCSETLGGDSVANIGRFVIYDKNAEQYYVNSKGDTTPGLASGKFRFPNTPLWDSVSFGTLIVIYNDKDINTFVLQAHTPDTSGKRNDGIRFVPVSALESVDSTDSIIPPNPDSSNVPTPSTLSIPEGTFAYITSPVNPPLFVDSIINWVDTSIGAVTESPKSSPKRVIQDWFTALKVSATRKFDVYFNFYNLVRNFPYNPDGSVDSICPGPVQIAGISSLPDSSVQFNWTLNGVPDYTIINGDTIYNTTDSLSRILHYQDSVVLTTTTTLKCITQHIDTVVTSYKGFNIYYVPNIKIYVGADSSKAIIDTLGRDTLGNLDSTITYKTFCRGATTKFYAIPNFTGPTDKYLWVRNGVIVSTDSVYIDSNITKGVDTLLCLLDVKIPCKLKTYDTTVIVLKGLDSIPIPTITIVGRDTTGNGSDTICSNSTDSFYIKFTYASLARDTSSRYQIQWLVNGNLLLQDTATYTDTSTTITKFGGSFNQGDSVQAILLATKTASCPYYSGTFVNPPDSLTDSSNKVGITVITSITPIIQTLPATQVGLCRFPFVDSIQFVAFTDSAMGAGKNPKFLWYLNGVLQQTNPSISMYPGTDSARTGSDSIYSLIDTLSATAADSTVYIGRGNLQYGTDTIGVQFINTTNKCFLTSDTSAIVTYNLSTFNPYPPVPSATLTQPTLCSSSLQQYVPFVPTNLQNEGTRPTYQWFKGVTAPYNLVSDSSVYVDSSVVQNDSISFILTSSVACAIPKDTLVGLRILIATAQVPSVTITSSLDTFCANSPQPPVITPTPINGGTGPTYTWYKVGTNGNPDSVIGNSSAGQPFNFPTVTDYTDILTWQVYCQMTSNFPCLTTPTANSDTITLTILPNPFVSPIILATNSVCQDYYIYVADTSTLPVGATAFWIGIPQGGSISAVQQTNPDSCQVTGLSPGPATVLYDVTGSNGCITSTPQTINVNPSENDSVAAFTDNGYPNSNTTICIGATDTLVQSLTYSNPAAQQYWRASNNNVSNLNVVSVIDSLQGGNLIQVVTFTGAAQGQVTIYDSIIDNCGTRVDSAVLQVGTPTVTGIFGKNYICTVGDTAQLSVITLGATSTSWNSSNPGVATVDNNGLVTAVSNGSTSISYTATNACGTTTPQPQPTLSIQVGKSDPGQISSSSGGDSICIGSSLGLSSSGVPGGVWRNKYNNIDNVNSSNSLVTGVAAGLDTITYTVTTFTCGDTTSTFPIVVKPGPPQYAINGDSILCLNGGTLTLTHPVFGGTWTWNAQLDNISINTNIIDSEVIVLTGLQTNGIDSVLSYTYTNAGCGSTTVYKQVIVGAPEIGAFTFRNPICVNDTVVLTNNTRGANLPPLWVLENTNVANYLNNNSTGDTAVGVKGGLTKLIYFAYNTCPSPNNTSIAYDTLYVTALPTPGAVIGTDSICVGGNTTFTDTSTNFSWSSYNTSVATVDNSGNIKGVSAGTAEILYKVSHNGCSDTTSKIITINPLPVLPPIAGNTIACFGRTTTLTDTLKGIWTTADATIAAIPNDSVGVIQGVTANKSTLISYTITDSLGCSNTVNATVNVNPIPFVAQITGIDSVCTRATQPLANATTGGTWWSDSTQFATINVNGLVTGIAYGYDTIYYSVTQNGCSDTVSVPMKVNANNVASIQGDSAICVGSVSMLTNATTGGTWKSDSTNIATIDAVTGSVFGVSIGTDSIYYTVTNTCGTTTDTSLVFIGAPVVTPIIGPDSLCNKDSVVFTNLLTPGGLWKSDSTNHATIDPITGDLIAKSAGKDTVLYTVTNVGGCSTTVKKALTINPLPVVAPIKGDSTICLNASATFTDDTLHGVWGVGNAAISITNTGVATGTAVASDTIKYTITDALGCVTTVYDTVKVTSIPVVAAISPVEDSVNIGRTIDFKDATTGGTWSVESDVYASIIDSLGVGVVTGIKEGKTIVKYLVTDANKCSDSSTATLIVLNQLNDVYAPNFLNPSSTAPNPDPTSPIKYPNSVFRIWGKYIASIDLKVFSPWGEELYSLETTDINDYPGWDGTNKSGKAEPSGVYVYTAKITLINGTTINKKGAVNLIR